MKKFKFYLICMLCSFSSFAAPVEVDLAGEVCVNDEFTGNTFVYTGILLERGPNICSINWEYTVIGGQIINVIDNGTTIPLPPGSTTHLGIGTNVQQITVQWLNNNSCNSVKFAANTGSWCLWKQQDEKTLKEMSSA